MPNALDWQVVKSKIDDWVAQVRRHFYLTPNEKDYLDGSHHGVRDILYKTVEAMRKVKMAVDENGIQFSGRWDAVSFLEIPAIKIASSEYWKENDVQFYPEILKDKINRIKNEGIQLIDFGTRRRISLAAHGQILSMLKIQCPNNFLGTSNVKLGSMMGLNILGSYGHEIPMVLGAVLGEEAGIIISTSLAAQTGTNMHVTDTFTSEKFSDCRAMVSHRNPILRHDSGCPRKFMTWAVNNVFFPLKIPSNDRRVCFSNIKSVDEMIELQRTYGRSFNLTFGVGGVLHHCYKGDCAPADFVMKPVLAGGKRCYKLSDDPAKGWNL